MKLVFICGAGMVSGKERQTFNLMRQLKLRGHDVACIMASWGSAEFERMLTDEGIRCLRMRIGFISKSLKWPAVRMTLHQSIYLPSLWYGYRRFIKSFRPHAVIHTNFHHLCLLLPVLGTASQIFYVHDYFAPGGFMKWLFKKFEKRVESYISVSDFISRSLPPLGVDPHKVMTVHNGIEVPRVSGHPGRQDIPTVGIVGQVSPWKGHAVLIAALAQVKELPWRVLIIGEGDEDFKDLLIQNAEKAEMADRLAFTGRLQGLELIYEDLDIVCVPSIVPESFGLTAVEPGFFKIPVICSDIGALPEVVQDGLTGVLVPAGDPERLADALRQLLTDNLRREQLGENAFRFALDNFSIEVCAARFEKSIESVHRVTGREVNHT